MFEPSLFCERREEPSSPYTSHFLSADTIVPGYTNPQNLNRYSYVSNNPLRYTDPTGHLMSDGGGGGHCDLLCVHEHNQNNNHSGGGGSTGGGAGHHNDNQQGGLLGPIPGAVDNYNYSVMSNNLPFYQQHGWFYDFEVTGQFGLVYSNNSALTINLDPNGLNVRNMFYQNNSGFSMNGGTQPSLGYAQSLPHSLISSATGINVNPITGSLTSNISVKLDGPITYKQSVSVSGSIKPMEAAVAAVGGAVVLSQVIPGPVDDAGIAIGAYKLCQATNLCP